MAAKKKKKAPRPVLPEGEKDKGGRPTKLTEELVRTAEAYAESCKTPDEVTVRAGFTESGDTRWSQTAPKVPNLARLSIECGIDRDTTKEWRKPYAGEDEKIAKLRERFSAACRLVEATQEACCIEDGASGRLAAAVVTRILAAKHGYAETTKSEVKQTLELTDERRAKLSALFPGID
jgi:hypothetical protein